MKTILLVEDDPWIGKLVSATIVRDDLRLVKALDGEEAVSKAVAERPSLILLDVNLPKRDGFEVCRILRSHPDFAQVPIVFLTAKSAPEDLEQGMAAGGTAYITKPFSPLQLLRTIDQILEGRTGGP